MTLNNLAVLYKNTQRFTESEQMYKEALEIRRRLAQANPQAYEPRLADTYYNIGLLYKTTQRQAESFHSFFNAMEIYKRLAVNDSSKQEDYDDSLNQLKKLYQKFKESGEIPPKCEEDVEKIKRMLEE